jgi:MFS family permease
VADVQIRTEPVEDQRASVLSTPWYANYVLGVLLVSYIVNVMDRSSVLALSLQAIKREFSASDFQLGLLTGIPFALFYSTLGIPIAAWADRSSRRNVLALAEALWSGMTALCGAAVNFAMLFATRIGTAVGEAGGSPPSHSLISDYFPRNTRGTAFSIFALGVPIGTALGNAIGGWANHAYGWRTAFILVGLPGIVMAAVVRLTVAEPPRGLADGAARSAAASDTPKMFDVLRFLWLRPSFRHLSLGTALHSVVWYAGGAFNAAFLIRSHHMTTVQAGSWLSVFAWVGALGTFFGGYAADRLSARRHDKRWYLWLPGFATLVMVPFQFFAYLAPSLAVALPAFAGMQVLAAIFFGPSFAMTQALAMLRMRSVATSLLLFVQTLIGQGLGPSLVGFVSDRLSASFGAESLRYALVIVGLVNLWAAAHYLWGARSLRQNLDETERLARTA